jgi:acyl-CoA synthetase (AMP-forming)/AMP-acid ligase II
MSITTILEMAASAPDRPAVTANGRSLTTAELLERAQSAAGRFRGYPAVVYLGSSHLAYPVALFGAALAGVPFVPLNYRLSEHQLASLIARHPGALVLRQPDLDGLVSPLGDARPPYPPGGPADPDAVAADPDAVAADPDSVAVLLYTSGTTAEPKAALLRHRHLLAYVLNTVEFASAGDGDATLVSVPPYHVAGLANLLTSLYAGRRIVYMATFDPGEWLGCVQRERITHAMVVPTMLARIVTAAQDPVTAAQDPATAVQDPAVQGPAVQDPASATRLPDIAPTLRNISYGGARMPPSVLTKALEVFPQTGFVNAYGLTETASSVAG